ncbi:MAG: hypothetical protein SGI77_21415 [Pirellulaceae bacterium]|nr:hypothetical protein [Pirellulaceae bacterium]
MNCSKTFATNELREEGTTLGVNGEYGKSNGCPSSSLIVDQELLQLAQCWSFLPDHVRQTIMTLAIVASSEQQSDLSSDSNNGTSDKHG